MLKEFLFCTTPRAHPVFRQRLKRCTSLNVILWIPFCWIVDVSARTLISLHDCSPWAKGYLLLQPHAADLSAKQLRSAARTGQDSRSVFILLPQRRPYPKTSSLPIKGQRKKLQAACRPVLGRNQSHNSPGHASGHSAGNDGFQAQLHKLLPALRDQSAQAAQHDA